MWTLLQTVILTYWGGRRLDIRGPLLTLFFFFFFAFARLTGLPGLAAPLGKPAFVRRKNPVYRRGRYPSSAQKVREIDQQHSEARRRPALPLHFPLEVQVRPPSYGNRGRTNTCTQTALKLPLLTQNTLNICFSTSVRKYIKLNHGKSRECAPETFPAIKI